MSKIIILGNEVFTSGYAKTPITEFLAENYQVSAIFIKNQPTRSRQSKTLAIRQTARKYNLKLIEVNQVADLKQIQKYPADLAVLASFGWLIPEELIDSLPIVNVHPSLLPALRGPSPIETALLHLKETGVSLVKLSPELDAGDIYSQAKFKIPDGISRQELAYQLSLLAVELLRTDLPLILQRKLEARPQNHRRATYTQKIKPVLIDDLTTHPATYWEKYIRAYDSAKFSIRGKIVKIASAQALQESNPEFYDKGLNMICLKTKEGSLGISRLQPANSKLMTASDFVNGLRNL